MSNRSISFNRFNRYNRFISSVGNENGAIGESATRVSPRARISISRAGMTVILGTGLLLGLVEPFGSVKAATQASVRNLPAQTAAAKGVVVMFGDSITENWLQQSPAFFANRPYVNKGISGDTTSQMFKRFKADALSQSPAVVVILGGINDFAAGTDNATIARIENNVGAMVDQARAINARTVISSVLPVGYETNGMQVFSARRTAVNGAIRKVNTRLKALAAKKGAIYLDYYAAVATPSGELAKRFNADNVHVSTEAYLVMAPLAEQAITASLRAR